MTNLLRFIRDLLDYDENLIGFGRENEDIAKSTTNYIMVDSLSPATPITRNQKIDGVNENITYGTLYRQNFTIDFYGINARENAYKLQAILKTDQSFYLQKEHKLSVGGAKQIVDVKALTGQFYINRCQLELVIQYSFDIELDVKRIDTAEFTLLKE